MQLWIKKFCQTKVLKLCITMEHLNRIMYLVLCSKTLNFVYLQCACDLINFFKFAKIKMYAGDLNIYAVINTKEAKNKF